jgi:hypothetical protein
MKKSAFLSKDRKFRYWLLRQWNPKLPLLAVVGCNPSKADEVDNDPTIRRVVGFARRLSFGGVLMLNVGAYRATDPKEWKAAVDPFGPQNTINHLQAYLAQFKPETVVAAWGKHCMSTKLGKQRVSEIAGQIVDLQCWGRNIDGSPRHPGRIAYSTQLEAFTK